MRIMMLAIGSHGDVQSLIALGVGIQRKGHQVRLVAGDEFEGLVHDSLTYRLAERRITQPYPDASC